MELAKKKKIAASIAAILHYESERAMEPVVPDLAPAQASVAQRSIPLWSAAGRQEQMSMRVFLQKRMMKAW